MSQLITMDSEPSSQAQNHVYGETLWYAGYTASRHEKRVAEHFAQRGVEHFLPLYETIHRWNNGRHRVELPLFPGYIFVRIALRDRLRVIEVPGFVRLFDFAWPSMLYAVNVVAWDLLLGLSLLSLLEVQVSLLWCHRRAPGIAAI